MSADHVLREPGGTVTVTAAAISGLVARAVESVPGAHVHRPKRGLDVALVAGRARVSLELDADFGTALPELGRAVQDAVAATLRRSCGIVADSVEVSIRELRA